MVKENISTLKKELENKQKALEKAEQATYDQGKKKTEAELQS